MKKLTHIKTALENRQKPQPIDKNNDKLYSSLSELMGILATINGSINALAGKIDEIERNIEVNVPPLDLSGIESAISELKEPKEERKPVDVKFIRDSEGKVTGFRDA